MAQFHLSLDQLRTRSSLKWRNFDADVLPLWVAEMDVLPPRCVVDAVARVLEAGDTGYPCGTAYADAFAQMAARRWGWSLDPDHVMQAGDVMTTIGALLATVTEPGDGVLINPPVYPPFHSVVTDQGRRLVEVPLTSAGRLDLTAIEAALGASDRPKAYLLCSPHNPTGTVHTRDELASVARWCAENGARLIVDEIHAALVEAGTDFVPVLSLPDAAGAVVATSAGKAWNLAGFRAGLAVFGPDAVGVREALPPSLGHASGHVASIAHATALLHAQDWVDEVMLEVGANKDLLGELLAEHLPGAMTTRQPGTYLAWVDCTALGLANPHQSFLDTGRVAFSPGADFAADHAQWVRINLATSPAILTEAIERAGRAWRATA